MGSTRKRACADTDSALLSRTREFLAARLNPGEAVCLGLSGGLDSIVLLHLLARSRASMGFTLTAVHVHHGLSEQADAWAEFCGQACAALDIPLNIERVDVARAGKGIEAAARAARYAAFARQNTDCMALAHHLDDQAETFFMRLLRGAGARGLGAMSEDADWRGMRLIRPLLSSTRAELHAYALSNGLSHVEDESNLDLGLTRNYLRHALLPALDARFPSYREIIGRDTRHLREAASLLDQLAREDAARLGDFEHPECAALLAMGAARGKNLLRHWLEERARLIPDEAQLQALWDQLFEARADADLAWRLGGVVVRRFHGKLYPADAWDDHPAAQEWRGQSALEWLGRPLVFEPTLGQGVSAAVCSGRSCRVVTRVGGERFRPDCRRPARALKDWLRESGLPPWERSQLPLLQVDGELAWVAGLGVDCRFQAGPGEPSWLISWRSHP